MIVPPAVGWAGHALARIPRRFWVRRRLRGRENLHLACGGHVLDGWANIDLQSKGDVIGWDLTDGLPLRSATIEFIYSEHFIEHLTLQQARALLAECHRVLRSDGILRLSTPSLAVLLEEYRAGRTSAWCDLGWSPATPCQLINEGFRLWGHQFVYDAAELTRTLVEAGFRQVTQTAWHASATPALRELECRPFRGELIFEAIK
jgi:predicted SAM-dependent methyltransferase